VKSQEFPVPAALFEEMSRRTGLRMGVRSGTRLGGTKSAKSAFFVWEWVNGFVCGHSPVSWWLSGKKKRSGSSSLPTHILTIL